MSPSKQQSPKILMLLSGSIACFKACALISKLKQLGYEIQTYATPAALKFVGTASLEGLSGKPVLQDLFQEQQMMAHINLVNWADILLVYPATANTINKMAAGLTDEGIGAFFLANNFQKPFWIAPAMNTQMWWHPATQKSVGLLKEWGAKFFMPPEGSLACGAVGAGRIEEPEVLVECLKQFFSQESIHEWV